MYTVIVADDEEEVRGALVRRVDWEKAGFRVVGEAQNGAEALEMVEQLEPDLLLTDIKMPFMSGIDLARAVREIRPTMHIAFFSGFDDFSYARQAIQYNIISYILKPVSSTQMMEELEVIRTKIDHKFKAFSDWSKKLEVSASASFTMSLLLNSFPDEDDEDRERRLISEAVSFGFPHASNPDRLYAVMATTLKDASGKKCTVPGSVHAVDSILKKYMDHSSFYSDGRIISLLSATRSGMNKYLHILVEEIAQSAKRISNVDAFIGVSRIISGLSCCHEAYAQAIKALNCSLKSDRHIQFLSDIELLTSGQSGKNVSILCEQTLGIIQTRYNDPELSLMSISNEIAVTPNYLSALIKKSTGYSFVELLTRKRVETAYSLLLNSSLKVREIAQQCGYNDQHYFSYSFKKATGLSPNACRKQAVSRDSL